MSCYRFPGIVSPTFVESFLRIVSLSFEILSAKIRRSLASVTIFHLQNPEISQVFFHERKNVVLLTKSNYVASELNLNH